MKDHLHSDVPALIVTVADVGSVMLASVSTARTSVAVPVIVVTADASTDVMLPSARTELNLDALSVPALIVTVDDVGSVMLASVSTARTSVAVPVIVVTADALTDVIPPSAKTELNLDALSVPALIVTVDDVGSVMLASDSTARTSVAVPVIVVTADASTAVTLPSASNVVRDEELSLPASIVAVIVVGFVMFTSVRTVLISVTEPSNVVAADASTDVMLPSARTDERSPASDVPALIVTVADVGSVMLASVSTARTSVAVPVIVVTADALTDVIPPSAKTELNLDALSVPALIVTVDDVGSVMLASDSTARTSVAVPVIVVTADASTAVTLPSASNVVRDEELSLPASIVAVIVVGFVMFTSVRTVLISVTEPSNVVAADASTDVMLPSARTDERSPASDVPALIVTVADVGSVMLASVSTARTSVAVPVIVVTADASTDVMLPSAKTELNLDALSVPRTDRNRR